MANKLGKKGKCFIVIGVGCILGIAFIVFRLCLISYNPFKTSANRIGEEYKLANYTLSVVNDDENERFVVKYVSNGREQMKEVFQFEIYYSLIDSKEMELGRDQELTCVDEKGDSIIPTEENAYQYEFTGSKIFYVSYAGISAEEKTAIVNRWYHIRIYQEEFYASGLA